ncbi:unnamed protein product [Rotaria sp. Silwood1]|nr:unnamed protein product [Rotaria sp. Silwood1]
MHPQSPTMKRDNKREINRNKLAIIDSEKDKLIERNSGYYDVNHKFNEEQLRYLVSLYPLQVDSQQYPKNKELCAAGKTCLFAATRQLCSASFCITSK